MSIRCSLIAPNTSCIRPSSRTYAPSSPSPAALPPCASTGSPGSMMGTVGKEEGREEDGEREAIAWLYDGHWGEMWGGGDDGERKT
ncbi:unnamed protein product [Closterium sp. Naga37s-1]|nr:unnamed protein product [Closterium sp. Naga37s-1]